MADSQSQGAARTGSRLGLATMGFGLVASGIWFLAGWRMFSNAGGPGLEFFVLGFFALVLAAAALVAVVGLAFGPMNGRQWVAWIGVAAVPFAFATLWVAVHYDVPLLVRLELSEDELIKHVAAVRAGTSPADEGTRVGSFTVHRVVLAGDCTVLVTNEGLFDNESGLVLCPPGKRPEKLGGTDYQRLRGRWWKASGL